MMVCDMFKVAILREPKFQNFFMFSHTSKNLFSFFFLSSRQYSLSKDVVSTLKKHRMHGQQFSHHPLLILNNFGSDGMHIKLMATMFQNMFPSINVHKVTFIYFFKLFLFTVKPFSLLMAQDSWPCHDESIVF